MLKMKKSFSTLFIIGIFAGQSKSVLACSMCFYGSPNNSAIIGLKMGVLTLLAILFVIFGLIIKFLINFNRRAQLSNKI